MLCKIFKLITSTKKKKKQIMLYYDTQSVIVRYQYGRTRKTKYLNCLHIAGLLNYIFTNVTHFYIHIACIYTHFLYEYVNISKQIFILYFFNFIFYLPHIFHACPTKQPCLSVCQCSIKLSCIKNPIEDKRARLIFAC